MKVTPACKFSNWVLSDIKKGRDISTVADPAPEELNAILCGKFGSDQKSPEFLTFSLKKQTSLFSETQEKCCLTFFIQN